MATFGQIPSNIDFSKMHIVADIAARDALTGLTHGDRCMVTGLGQFGLEFFFGGSDWVPVSGQVIYDEELSAEGGFDTGAGAIPGIFRDLVVLADLRRSAAGNPTVAGLRFNNDTGSTYRAHRRFIRGDNNDPNVDPGSEAALHVLLTLRASAIASVFAANTCRVSLYADATKRRMVHTEGSARSGSGIDAADSVFAVLHGVWLNTTTAISQVATSESDFIAGSRLTIIGEGTA